MKWLGWVYDGDLWRLLADGETIEAVALEIRRLAPGRSNQCYGITRGGAPNWHPRS